MLRRRGPKGAIHPLLLFGFVFALSWPFWIVAIVLGIGMETPLGIVLALLGLLGQKVAGLIAMRYTYDKEERRDYWRRVIDTRRIPPAWYGIIFLLVPISVAVATILDIFTGGSGAEWGKPALDFLANPWTLIPFSLLIFFVGPMEEFTWRGYVLDRLQERWNALTSSLVLGVFWSLWHLPLFFFRDSFQYNLGAGSAEFWQFMLGIVPLNFVFTWIHNNTGRSILAAMLFHFMVNFTAEFVVLTQRADLLWMVFWTIAAVSILIVYGAKTFTRKHNVDCGLNTIGVLTK